MAIFILGEFGFLLTTIAMVFVILIFIANCFPTSFILLVNSESSFSFAANIAVSSALSKIVVMCASHVDTLHIENMSEHIFRV